MLRWSWEKNRRETEENHERQDGLARKFEHLASQIPRNADHSVAEWWEEIISIPEETRFGDINSVQNYSEYKKVKRKVFVILG